MQLRRILNHSYVMLALLTGLSPLPVMAQALTYEDYPIVKLRTLDKITARTMTFEARVGTTMKFGEIYIKVQTCRKPPPVEKTEAAAFLQIWETDSVKDQSKWIFSGWMFASSPTLSAMDHPVYDVWVIDCLGKDPEALPPEATATQDGTVPEGSKESEQPPAENLKDQDEAAFARPADSSADSSAESEAEPVPASNMPADVKANPAATDEVQETAPVEQQQPQEEQPPVAPVSPAPEPQETEENFQGIY